VWGSTYKSVAVFVITDVAAAIFIEAVEQISPGRQKTPETTSIAFRMLTSRTLPTSVAYQNSSKPIVPERSVSNILRDWSVNSAENVNF